MNPQIFGWQHLTFLAIFIVISVISLYFIKRYAKSTKTQDIIVRCVGVLLFACILWNRISIAIRNGNALILIPDTFCGLSSLVLSLAVIFGKRNNNVLHFVLYVAFVGDLLTLCYPDFIEQNASFFYNPTISGLLHHAVGLYLCILLGLIGWFIPNYKKWPNLVIGFMAYITFGTFLIHVLNFGSAFYINSPILDGTPLTVWVIAPVFGVGYALYMVALELLRRRKKRKKQVSFDQIIKIIKSEP